MSKCDFYIELEFTLLAFGGGTY